MKFLFVVVLLVFRAVANMDQLDVEVEHQCMQRCSSQNRSDIGDYTCDIECSNIQQQCEKGCKLWNEALNSSCYKICNGYSERITPKDMYCVMGCNDAIAKYFSQLRLRIGTPQAPVLVADSLNATSLKLEWNFPPEGRRNGLSCYIQWKYEEMSATWQYCRNITWNTDSTIAAIFNLQPYTKYRFRVVLVPIHHGEPISSAKSVVIGTLSSGVPESEPVIDISPDVNHYLIRNLSPTKAYNISLRMRNGVGLGPPAHVTVTTPPEPLIRGTQSPILILGTEHSVIEQGTYIMDEPVVLYETEKQIRGIAVHISKKLLFVSESDGRVAKMSLINKSTTYILTPAEINFKPLHLSIDWLNNLLYILGEVGDEQKEEEMNRRWQIVRCNLDGSALTVAVAGLTTKPHTIEVDPYNGYVFWAVKGIEKGGIYRLDLSDISNGIKHEVRPEMILKDANLGAFTMDHTNFSLLVSMQEENTIYSVSLDGKEIYNTRPRVVKSKMHKIVSLATANKKFYWTDGDSVFYEEYKDDYYHNSYPDLASRSYKRLIINLGSSQPIPIPVNPPINAQAIFGTNEAKTSWNAPHLIGGQGKGAWQNWSYEIAFKDVLTNSILTLKDINTTSCTLKNLKDNSKYIVKAAAYTNFGRGPWSKEFVGSTLSNKTEKPFVLWSAAEGLLMSDATGQNVKTLIHGSNMKNFIVTDIAWYKDQIYLVTNNSHMLWYNMTSHRQGKLLESVASIAIDWIGQKLYWSNPKQQMIFRSNLDGTQQEPSISTLAKELNIDSIKAYMYWSTGYAVECAHLNGADKMNYHSAQLFSGKQVMGVTLDMDQKYVYWIVRGSEGSNLFKAVMAGYHSDKIIAKKVASLQKPNMQGPLCYFHKRLLWLQDDRSAAISDLEGQNIATVSGTTMSDLSMVYVVDPTQHIIPDAMSSLDDIIVIPEVIDRNTVTVVGSSESFNISWRPTDNVNYGSVFYEVQIDNLSRNDSTVITSFPSVKYWQTVTPYTKLDVTIRAYTYWGTSAEVRVKIFSPPSTPSAPRNLRSYVMYQANSTDENIVSITFRWDMPLFPNGVIRGFKIYCWCYKNGTKEDICKKAVSRPDKMEYVSKNLMKNETYFFEARAHTNIRDGNMSETLTVNANQETPLPTLLIASTDSIFIQDIDANQNYSLIHGISTPTEMGYLIKENKLFWINQMKELLMLNNVNSNKTKLCDINGEPIGLTVDWLERSLYFAEKFNETSIIKKLNLNLFEKGILKISEIFIRPHVISKLEISPFAKKLYWIEIKNAWTNRLMESNADGSNIRNFFSKLRSKRYVSESQPGHECNCPSNPDIEKTFSVDHSNSTIKPLLIFYDNNAKNIISADKNACICNIIANHSVVGNFLPLRKIKSDFNTLYWTSLKQNFLYALKRQETNVMSKEVSVSDISIFGHHVQPYPPKKCLSPKHITHLKASLKGRTSNSLVLTMPDLFLEDNCAESSVATTEYQICYGEYGDDCFACNNHCKKMVRFSKEIEIVGLKPFLKYNVWISVSNHYTKDEEKVIGGAAVFRTAPGAPSKPPHVSAIVLNPTLAKVLWIPPKEFNGALVYYEIHWQTEVARNGVRKKEEKPVLEHQTLHNSNKLLTAYLRKLSPNETYTVWVRAYCETNETWSDSDRIRFITYPVPNNLTLLNRTSDSMALSWIISDHVKQSKVQYTPLMLNEWQDIDSYEVDDDGALFFHLKDLKPKSAYKFRLCLTYENYTDIYIWSPDREFTFETLGDRPSPPGMPVVHYFKPNVYKVWWEASKDNGAPIDLYKLEGMILRHFRSKRGASNNRTAYFYTAPAVEEDVKEWIQLYNGTETSWIIDGLSEDFKYIFRVMSFNSYGWSDPSKDSSEFDLNEAARMADKQTAMTAIVVATSITMTFIFVVVIVITFFACKCTNKKKEPQLIHIPRGPDVELATLRELPRRGVHSTNILYVATQPTPEEIKLLPHIKREQITLTKFLGSGAFGEVFEGKAREMGIHKGDTKVAIKTLRKSASDLEKTEFLQEAQMMSHFKHEHILELLGVCLDNDPHFIIMELMEGGDLLTYLRTSRNPVANTPCLTLIELLKMCVDVSKGCRYLEEMHFVHRDLACRNCLVSSTAPESRIVKIGDFGLARDIYKNDYYRKEGEGLLPVRWMAPESLVDGVFTSQSDVWAFGILLWELMTLGQQPYPARNNLEVLHYVRGGGRLGKPIDCPVELHSLMLKCWEFEPDNRPYFKYCLEVLENLHQQNLRNPRTGAHEGQYISTVPECASWKPENEEQNKENTPFLDRDNEGTQLKASTSIPKYLELLYAANNSSLENDGYEIPNRMLQTSDTSTSTKNKKYSLNNSECSNVKLEDSNSKSA